MGLWALIIGFTSILSQSTAAVNTNIIREVAEADDEHYQKKAAALIVNGLIIYGFFFLVLSVFVITSFILIFKQNFQQHITLITLILTGVFINLLATIFSSVLDARRLNYIKNIFLAIANLLFIVICFFTISCWGLNGVAIAQIIQAFVLLIIILSFVFLKLRLSIGFKQISISEVQLFFKDSWKLQSISLLVLCYEPITKYFLSKYGLSYVAKYEVANKIIAQVRNIFTISNQTLLSYFVNKLTQSREIFLNYFLKINQANSQWAFIASSLLLIISPLISSFFLKQFDWSFILLFSILLFSNFINIISITAYFNFFAQKKYNIPFISHIIIAVLNIFLSVALGYLFNGLGVVVAWSFSLFSGSIYIIYLFNKYEVATPKNQSTSLKAKKSIWLLVASISTVFILYLNVVSAFLYIVLVILFIITLLIRAFKLYQSHE